MPQSSQFEAGTGPSRPDFAALVRHATDCHDRQQFADAIEFYRQAIALRPTLADLHLNVGVDYFQLGDTAQAIGAFSRAAELASESVNARVYLAMALTRNGQWDVAVARYRDALVLDPTSMQSWANLGDLFHRLSRLTEAETSYRRAISLEDQLFELYLNFGAVLTAQQRYEDAVVQFERAIELNPKSGDAYSNLGVAYRRSGRIDEAVAALSEAIRLSPNLAVAHGNLGVILEKRGDPDAAGGCYAQAAALDPSPANLSKMLFNINYCETHTALSVAAEHRRIGGLFDAIGAQMRQPHPPRHAKARYRLAFTSPDFRNHSVSFFLRPLLRAIDRERFEVVCYSDVTQPDPITVEIRGLCDHWRDVFALNDIALAQQIRADGIDMLVDLAGQSPGNRMATYAMRPAPLQLTWLGYANSTGLSSIDFRIVDAISDPAPEADGLATERLLRLPQGFLCYEPPLYAPPVTIRDTAPITFGSFNNPSKITSSSFDLWAALLRRCPQARLLLKSHLLEDNVLCRHLIAAFEDRGITADRLSLRPGDIDPREHLASYGDVDIALDPVLYNGTTTSCEALWMGVPLVTLRGDRHASRVGASLLQTLDCPELIAETPDQYLEIASRLANDSAWRLTLRRSLRDRFAQSPLCDAASFARRFAEGLLAAWGDRGDSPGEANPRDRLATLLQHWEQDPQASRLAEARDARNRWVAAILRDGRAALGPLGEVAPLIERVVHAGLTVAVEDESERALLVAARQRLMETTSDRDGFCLVVAHCLLVAAYHLPAIPDLAACDRTDLPTLLSLLFGEPIFWSEANQPARHAEWVTRVTAACRKLLDREPLGDSRRDLAMALVNAGRFTQCYFADMSLRTLAIEKAAITEAALQALGGHLDHRFPPRHTARLRVGCYRKNWQTGTETAALLAHLRGLDQRFDIILYSQQPLGDSPCERAAAALASIVRTVGDNVAELVATIRSDDLDIYLIGHNITAVPSLPLFVSAFRLARWQLATTVCPATTALQQVDGYLNAALNERPGAQDDYCEQLVLAPGSINLYDFHEDLSVDPQATRQDLGLEVDRFLFVSGANVAKISVELLQSWSRILTQTPGSQLLLYPYNPHWRTSYPRAAFERHVRTLFHQAGLDGDRLRILPPQPDRSHIRALLRCADLYLDSFPFSGAVSMQDPIEAHCPIVLKTGDQARCRQSTGMALEFGLPAIVTESVADYEASAIRLWSDPRERAALRAMAPACLQRLQQGRLRLADLLADEFSRRLDEDTP